MEMFERRYPLIQNVDTQIVTPLTSPHDFLINFEVIAFIIHCVIRYARRRARI